MARHSQRQVQKPPKTKTGTGRKATTITATRSKTATKLAHATATAQDHGTVTDTASKALQGASGTVTVQRAAAAAAATVVATSSATAQMISLKQSLDLTKIMLYSSISSIAYLRNWFPDSSFEDQVLYLDPKHLTYDQFATGHVSAAGTSRRQNTYRCLMRGRRPDVDKFLDLIEKGLFDAVEKQALKAFRVDVTDPSRGNAYITESYIFTLKYATNSDGIKVVEDLEILGPQSISGPQGKIIPGILSIKLDMDMGIRRAVEVCKTLPVLLTKSGLDVTTYYTEDSDPSYWGPGFSRSSKTSIYFAQVEEWDKATSHCGVTDMRHYAASLKIQHLQPKHTAVDSEILPLNLRYNKAILGESDIDSTVEQGLAVKHAALRKRPDQENASRASSGTYRSSHVHSSPTSLTLKSLSAQPLSRLDQLNFNEENESAHANNLQTVDEVETQGSTQARLIRTRLRNMLQPMPENLSTEETQILAPHSAQTKMLDWAAQLSQLQLSRVKLVELTSCERALAANPSRGKSKRNISAYVDDVVQCQCDNNEEDGHMLQCDFCNRWQHSVCYGYVSETDPRLPNIHACYNCLLEEREGHLLKKLSALALLRKGASITINHGYNKDLELSSRMNCSLKTAADVIRHLREMGYLQTNPISRKKSFSSHSQPKFTVVVDEEVHGKMMKECFDPTSHIQHHFELSYLHSDTAKTTQWPKPPQDSEMGNEPSEAPAHFGSPFSALENMGTTLSRACNTHLSARPMQPTVEESRKRSSKLRTSLHGGSTEDLDMNANEHRTPNKRDYEYEDYDSATIAKKFRVGGPTSSGIVIGHSPVPYLDSDRIYSPE